MIGLLSSLIEVARFLSHGFHFVGIGAGDLWLHPVGDDRGAVLPTAGDWSLGRTVSHCDER